MSTSHFVVSSRLVVQTLTASMRVLVLKNVKIEKERSRAAQHLVDRRLSRNDSASRCACQRAAIRCRMAGRQNHIDDQRLVVWRHNRYQVRSGDEIEVMVVAREVAHQIRVGTIDVDLRPPWLDVQLEATDWCVLRERR